MSDVNLNFFIIRFPVRSDWVKNVKISFFGVENVSETPKNFSRKFSVTQSLLRVKRGREEDGYFFARPRPRNLPVRVFSGFISL